MSRVVNLSSTDVGRPATRGLASAWGVYECNYRALQSPFVVIEGWLQRRGRAISVLAHRVTALEIA